MTTPPPPEWIERLQLLHPLLKAPPRRSAWATRQARIDEASKKDAAAARQARAEIARRRERDYDNAGVTWAGFAIIAFIVLIGVFLIFRLFDESKIEDCLLAHRHNCDALLDR